MTTPCAKSKRIRDWWCIPACRDVNNSRSRDEQTLTSRDCFPSCAARGHAPVWVSRLSAFERQGPFSHKHRNEGKGRGTLQDPTVKSQRMEVKGSYRASVSFVSLERLWEKEYGFSASLRGLRTACGRSTLTGDPGQVSHKDDTSSALEELPQSECGGATAVAPL